MNGKTIKSAKQFLRIVEDLPKDKWVRVLIQRGDNPQFLAIKIEK